MLLIGALGGIGLIVIGWVCCDALHDQRLGQVRRERERLQHATHIRHRELEILVQKQAEAVATSCQYKQLATNYRAHQAGLTPEQWRARQREVGE